VISTALGVEGLPLRAGEHYLRAETAAEWVAATEQLRTGTSVAMAERARAALGEFTWPRIAERLVDVYRAL
jgi:hypothetical protein